jgi:hypothetical protein
MKLQNAFWVVGLVAVGMPGCSGDDEQVGQGTGGASGAGAGGTGGTGATGGSGATGGTGATGGSGASGGAGHGRRIGAGGAESACVLSGRGIHVAVLPSNE